MVDGPVEDTIVLIVYAHDRPGVLARIAGAFYRRGMNICALSARPTGEPELSKILVRVVAPRAQIERVAAALRNLIDVLSVALSNAPVPSARSD
jgi:acetolactate synthase small subunit